MRKIAVIFPGVGYTKDRPLLYYAARIAANCEYELRFIDISGIEWSKDQLKDQVFLLKTLEKCLMITEKKQYIVLPDLAVSTVVYVL